jgi:PAS domain S-box-containing protein
MSTERSSDVQSNFFDAGLANETEIIQSLVGAAGSGLVVVGPDSTIQWIDTQLRSYFSCDSSSVVGTNREAFLETYVRPCLENPSQFRDSDGTNCDGAFDCHVLPSENREERWLQYETTPITTGQLAGGHIEQFTDVTANQLRERFEYYRRIVETTDDAAYVLDSESNIEYANAAALAQTEQSLSVLTGRPMSWLLDQLLPAESSREAFEHALADTLSSDGGESATVQERIETSAGRQTYSFECTPTPGGAVIIGRDVSRQCQRERRYETLIENFPNGAVTLVDQTLRYQLAGGKLLAKIGEDPGSVVGSNVGDLDAGDRDVFAESYTAALNGEPSTVETSVGDRTLVLRAVPVYDDDGAVRTAIGMTQDITDRKHREEELRWKSRALDKAPVGVTITDPQREDNPMIYVNQQFCEQSGYDTDNVISENCRLLQGPNTDPETVSTIRAAIDAEQPVSVEIQNYRKDGTPYWNHLDIAPVRDESWSLVNYVGFQRDVTERKERERELQELNRRLNIALEETGTGVWVLEHGDNNVTSCGNTAELFGLSSGEHELEAYLDMIQPPDRRVVEDAVRAAREQDERLDVKFRVIVDDTERWLHSRGTVFDKSQKHPRMVGVVTDITDRKHRVDALEKRERILNELHTATREFYPPASSSDITEFLAEFTENAFGVEYVSVKQFDEETGTLTPAARSGPDATASKGIGVVQPGSNPIWETYRTGETRLYASSEVDELTQEGDGGDGQVLVSPVGDFGVLVAMMPTDSGFDKVDTDLFEVLTANAESAFQRLRSDKVHSEITAEISAQQSHISELSGVIDSVQAIQRRLADSECRDTLHTGVCEELISMDPIDFVWVAQPGGKDTDLSPMAMAGDADGYLDSVLAATTGGVLPAQRAAADHQQYTVDDIPSRVLDEQWAKEAMSYEFRSVSSTPLVYDGVLYGVLTAYSSTEEAFGEIYGTLFTDITSLMVNYIRILEQRQGGTEQLHTHMEFAIDASVYPLQRLAEITHSTIRFDTVTERLGESLRILVTVSTGDTAAVLDSAASMTDIDAAERFGNVEDGQLSLLVQKPFLESVVSKHGGRLVTSESTANRTTAQIAIPPTVSHRPILDALTTRYETIDLLAKRQAHTQTAPDTAEVEDILTARQYEIIKAAFHGGYYKTPRQVTGEDIAENFGISGPAVYNHLQAAHRTLLEFVLGSHSQTHS